MNNIKISEMFVSLQGEGRHAGEAVVFIRFSGCTRKCTFCDTKQHIESKDIKIDDINYFIDSNKNIKTIVFTGGEPLLYLKDLKNIMRNNFKHEYHLETNGDLLTKENLFFFDYISCSPKDLDTAKRVKKLFRSLDPSHYDIKVVTDLELNKNLIEYATLLMPLSVDFNGEKDRIIEQNVWNYCVKQNIKFCLRQHVKVWGKKIGV